MTQSTRLKFHLQIAICWILSASISFPPLSVHSTNPDALDLIMWMIGEVALLIVIIPFVSSRIPLLKMFFFTQAFSSEQLLATTSFNLSSYRIAARNNNYTFKWRPYAAAYFIIGLIFFLFDFILEYFLPIHGYTAIRAIPLAGLAYINGLIMLLGASVLICRKSTNQH